VSEPEPVEPPTAADVRAALTEVEAVHRRTEAIASALAPDDLREPSHLPGWTRAHVVAHLANNAMAFAGMLVGLPAGHEVPQYPGGDDQRAIDIEARSALDAAALVDLLRWAHVQFEAAAAAMDDDDWFRPSEARGGGVRPAWAIVWSRWREGEVHLVDLDAGYGIADWSQPFVDVALAAELRCLARRLPRGVDGPVATAGEAREVLWSLMDRGRTGATIEAGGRTVSFDELVEWGTTGWMPGVPDRS
jgi:uncharacterized protein (TIGR03083 family)